MGRKQSPILNDNRLKLGFFSANCSGGMSVTKVPERWVNSWDNNIRLAQLADEAGIEFMLPARAGSVTEAKRIFTAAYSRR